MDPRSREIKHGEQVWIGFDFDGTLVHRESGASLSEIGNPISINVQKLKKLLEDGWRIKIFTARVSNRLPLSRLIEQCTILLEWCIKHIGRELELTCEKDPAMIELWDDRCVAVESNTGMQLSPSRIRRRWMSDDIICPTCNLDTTVCSCLEHCF